LRDISGQPRNAPDDHPAAALRRREFRRDRAGNVRLTFALALILIVGAVGAAVDYSRANNFRSQLMAAADSAAVEDVARDDLQQPQLSRHHALHRAGQHRRRSDLDAAAELPGQPGQIPLLRQFFLLTSASQIITTFQQIGTTLSDLRVAK